MWEKIADPGAALAEAALLGALLSAMYDLFRIRRALLPLLSGPDRQVMSLTPDDPEAFPMLLAWCQATLARLAGHT